MKTQEGTPKTRGKVMSKVRTLTGRPRAKITIKYAHQPSGGIRGKLTVDPPKELSEAELTKMGYVVCDFDEFLGLSASEKKLVELRVKMAALIRAKREARKMSQSELAGLLKTTQRRVAKMEAAAKEVSMDKMLGGFFTLGGSVQELGTVGAGGTVSTLAD